jgi:hypothetical protein
VIVRPLNFTVRHRPETRLVRTSAPPPPDTTKLLHRSAEVERVYSFDKRFCAVLLRDDRGFFRVACEMWELSARGGFWNPVGKATITDTIENARRLALERLRKLCGDV